jgi:hypothetical protein
MTKKNLLYLPKNPLKNGVFYFDSKDMPNGENMKKYMELEPEQVHVVSSSRVEMFHLVYGLGDVRNIRGLFRSMADARRFMVYNGLTFEKDNVNITTISNPKYQKKVGKKRKYIMSDRDFDRRFLDHYIFGQNGYWNVQKRKNPKTGEMEEVYVSPHHTGQFN